MQNVIYAVIGVILTVAGMMMVSPSISKSSEAIQTNLIVTEASSIKTASKTWLASNSENGTFEDFNTSSILQTLPDFKQDGDYVYSINIKNKHKIEKSTTDSINDSITITTECESDDFAQSVRDKYKNLGDVTNAGTGKIAIVKIKG